MAISDQYIDCARFCSTDRHMAMNHNISSPRVWKPDDAISSFLLSKLLSHAKRRG